MLTALLLWAGQALAGRAGLLIALAIAGAPAVYLWSMANGAFMRNRTRTVLGYVLLVSGVVGVVLPFVPGTPFLIAAVVVLGSDHPVIRPWKEHVDRWIKRDRKSKEMNE